MNRLPSDTFMCLFFTIIFIPSANCKNSFTNLQPSDFVVQNSFYSLYTWRDTRENRKLWLECSTWVFFFLINQVAGKWVDELRELTKLNFEPISWFLAGMTWHSGLNTTCPCHYIIIFIQCQNLKMRNQITIGKQQY